jgi:hypothetical protein
MRAVQYNRSGTTSITCHCKKYALKNYFEIDRAMAKLHLEFLPRSIPFEWLKEAAEYVEAIKSALIADDQITHGQVERPDKHSRSFPDRKNIGEASATVSQLLP